MSTKSEQVLAAAAELLARKPGASMDEVARAAGISRATLHRYFAGRDALVTALGALGVRRLDECVDAAAVGEGSASDAVRRLVEQVMPVAGFLAFLYTEHQLFEQDRMDDGWRRVDDRISGLFRRGQQEGEFRPELPPAWLTEALYALVAASDWSVQDGQMAPKDAPTLVIELLLGGALARKPA
ncbi:TetR/AcrR family transcriptional regulator [Streptomyces alkaliterrae]|uniref:TetR family transcriptional regulator n=1 Tax=Streptomyces alkaliterrae TaxID=2213162 RepID=A0A5P0YME4_9ACTN|nr:TetR/AcrR family transcriptional regulator [Streptomyces alkaliterrae]MBB1255941.1 TetR/AcrR family transcriptional regulator [Streptomyces alkaliterrae]MBB1261968.1 TetR/AcrR family transcriptional regulator [Streptomyces alkaliterrae]MQS01466.1 TetR family transcriptional regulator [Streptomyces alkaliterrae]